MASTDATPIPVKNQAYRVTFPILDADGDLVTGAATLDSEVSKDAGTFADCTNEATEIATSSGIYYLDLTATEMNADTIAVIVKTGTAGAKTTTIVLYPRADGADFEVDVTHWNGSAVATVDTAGYPVVTVKDGTGAGEIALTAGAVDTVTALTNGVSLAAGAVTNASLAGNMEIVFETDFATNYNATRNAWATNAQDFVGTTAADPFNGQVVAASVTGAVGSVTGHTNQTGDTYALANGATGFAAIDTVVDAIKVVTDAIGTTGTGLSAIPWNAAWDAEVESEVIDALDTAISELGVGAPSATPGLRDAVMLLYMALRNKTVVQTSGTDALEIYNNAGTKIAAKTLTDDGSDYTEAEMA